MTNKTRVPKASELYQHITALIDNMESAADCGVSVGYEARKLLSLIDRYGKALLLEDREKRGLKDE